MVNVQLSPLYRADAEGLDLSDDVVDTEKYISWFWSQMYQCEDVLTN